MTQTISLSQNRSVHRTVLPNGIVLLVTENPAADIISARMFLRGGQRSETPATAGVAHLVAAVMTKGTATRSSMQIAEAVESVGASLGTDASADYFLVSVKTVSSDFPEIFPLAAEVLRSPSFPEMEVELERKLTLQGIRSQQEQPFAVAMDKLRHALYGSHPYANSGLGTLETVTQLSRDDLLAYHRTWFRPDNLVISLAGRITPEVALEIVDRTLGDWQAPATPLPTIAHAPISHAPQQAITPQETQQSIVMLGYLAASIHPEAPSSTDFAALKLLNTYLGNGLSSRLFVELREKRGLAYEVSAFYPTRLDTSHFVAYMGTAPQNTQSAIDGLRAELDRLTIAPLSETELQTAKNKLLGQYALGKQTNAQIAQTLGWYEMLGLGVDFDRRFPLDIAAVTAETAQETAQRCFGEPYLSVLGPESIVGS